MKYIGIDGCRSGWFYISIDESQNYEFGILSHISELRERMAEAKQILIDIPIGLRGKHTEERACDKIARQMLKPSRSSSVFPAPSRHSLAERSYKEASRINRLNTGRGLSQQSFALSVKIREIDEFMQSSRNQRLIREMHPEVCFCALNSMKPMASSKKTDAGFNERVHLLLQYFPSTITLIDQAFSAYLRKELSRDDIVDALVGALVASKAPGLASIPKTPDVDDTGLEMEMVYWIPDN